MPATTSTLRLVKACSISTLLAAVTAAWLVVSLPAEVFCMARSDTCCCSASSATLWRRFEITAWLLAAMPTRLPSRTKATITWAAVYVSTEGLAVVDAVDPRWTSGQELERCFAGLSAIEPTLEECSAKSGEGVLLLRRIHRDARD